MVKSAVVFVIAVVMLVISCGMKVSLKNEKKKMANYKQTRATIDRVIFSDTGNAKYVVSFFENGNRITAQTDHYSSKAKSLNPGYEVRIGYYFTKKGLPWAVILDERVIPVSNHVSGYARLFAVIGVLLLLFAAVMFVTA